jgi:hypothetical protein
MEVTFWNSAEDGILCGSDFHSAEFLLLLLQNFLLSFSIQKKYFFLKKKKVHTQKKRKLQRAISH